MLAGAGFVGGMLASYASVLFVLAPAKEMYAFADRVTKSEPDHTSVVLGGTVESINADDNTMVIKTLSPYQDKEMLLRMHIGASIKNKAEDTPAAGVQTVATLGIHAGDTVGVTLLRQPGPLTAERVFSMANTLNI